MSKHHVSQIQASVLSNVKKMSNEELVNLYGVEISEDGSVFDPTENRKFKDIDEWAMFIAEQEDENNYGHLDKFARRNVFDDDY